MESQWFTTSPFFRLTSPEHSVFRRQNLWLPLKAVVTTFCARGECSKNPHLEMLRLRPRRTSRHRGGQVGAATTQLEGHSAGLEWPGTSGEPCLRFVVPHWPKFHEARIRHPALRAVETAPGPSSNVRWTISSDAQVERQACGRASPHLSAMGPQPWVLNKLESTTRAPWKHGVRATVLEVGWVLGLRPL